MTWIGPLGWLWLGVLISLALMRLAKQLRRRPYAVHVDWSLDKSGDRPSCNGSFSIALARRPNAATIEEIREYAASVINGHVGMKRWKVKPSELTLESITPIEYRAEDFPGVQS